MSKRPTLTRRSLISILAVITIITLNQMPEGSRAQGSGAAAGTYGPLGEWMPYQPTPTVDSSVMLSPTPTEAFGQPTKTPSASPTASPTEVAYVSATPEVGVTLTPLPNETDYVTPQRATHTPGPSATAEDIVTTTPQPTNDPTETPDPEVEQTATSERTETPLPIPTDELGAVTVTPKSEETNTPTPTATETPTATATSSGLYARMPQPDGPPVWFTDLNIRALPKWQGGVLGWPEAFSDPETPDAGSGAATDGVASTDTLDTGSDELPGNGFQPSTVRGSVGLWTGSTTLNFPIPLPPGPNGSAPQLSLGYSSNVAEDVTFDGGKETTAQETYHKTQASPFGYGWNLGGIPMISIVPKVTGEFGDVGFGYELSVDGLHVRLIKPYVDPARNGEADKRIVYQTYPQSFVYVARTRKYIANEALCGQNGVLKEDRWEVITKDGTHIEFGATNNVQPQQVGGVCGWVNVDDRDAVQFVRTTSGSGSWVWNPGKWYATQVTDTHGNVIRYSYRREAAVSGGSDVYDAAVTVKKISYGGPTVAAHRVAVEFPVQTSSGQEVDREDCVIWSAQGDWYCNQSAPPGSQNAVYRSKRLVTAIVVKIKDRWDTWSTVRAVNLGYQYHYHPSSGHKQALLTSVQLADKLASDTSAVKLPPYTMTYLTDSARINWLPLKTFNNGLGGEWEYSYGETTVTCKDVETGNQKGHPRRPAATELVRVNLAGTDYPVAKIENSYYDGRCTEKFGHSYGGIWNDWYEFLGFKRAERVTWDMKQTTSTGDDVKLEFTNTQFNRCIEESGNCDESQNGNNPVEPHPLKGEVRLQELRPESSGQLLKKTTSEYTVEQNVSLPYIGLPSAPAVGTTWSHLDKVEEKQWGLSDATGGTGGSTYSEMGKVTSYAYEASLQGGTQRGLRTRQQEFLAVADYPSTPYRTKKTWYAAKESIDGADFRVTMSVYMVDRVMAAALYSGAGGSSDPQQEVIWNYYDGRTLHTNGVETKGELTKTSKMQAVAAFITTPSFTTCTGTVQRYLTADAKRVYTSHGNVQDETTYPDFGQVCIVNPNQSSQSILVDTASPTQARTTTTSYDAQLNALPIQRQSPTINSVRYTTKWEYFGLNNAAATSTEGYFVGQLYQVVDPNNIVKQQFAYDKLGRKLKILRAGDTLSQPSQAMVYADDAYLPQFPTMQALWTKREPGADAWTDGGSFERTFVDGLGRTVETQKPHYNWVSSPVSGNDVVLYRGFDARDMATTVSNPYLKSAYTGTGTGCGGSGQPKCNPYVSPDTSKPKTTTEFDATGRPKVITQPDAATVVHHYGVGTGGSANLWLDDLLDPKRHRRQMQTDSLGRQKKILEYDGDCATGGLWNAYSCGGSFTTVWSLDATTNYVYDVLDRLTTMTEPGGSNTTVSYNMLGHKTTMTDPDMGTWAYSSDAVGNLKYQDDARGQRVCHFYDTLYRLTEKRYFSSGSTCTTTGGTAGPLFTYDGGSYGKGRRTGMNNQAGFYTAWTLDSRGRPSRETQTLSGAGGGTYSTDYTYKRNDAVDSVLRPEDASLVYTTYNPVGLKRTYDSGGVDYVYDTAYTADQQVDLQKLDTGGSVQVDLGYDTTSNRLTSNYGGTYPSYQELQKTSFSYDAAGNFSQIVDLNLSQTQSFSYDQRDRLKTAVVTGGSGGTYGTETYVYGTGGNISSNAGISYAYHASKIHAVRKIYDGGSSQSKAFSVFAARSTSCAASITVDLYVNGTLRGHGFLNGAAGTPMTVALGTYSISADNVIDVAFSPIGTSCTVSVDNVTIGGVPIQAEGGGMVFDAGTGSASQDGNSVSVPTVSGGNVNLIVDGALRFVQGARAGAYEYDADGNMAWRIVDGHAFNMLWDQENRLSEIKRQGTSRALFTYDADGARVKALLDVNRTFYVGGLYEYTQNNGTGATVEVVRHYDANGRRVALRQGATIGTAALYWVLTDQINSTTRTVAATTRTVNSELRYKPWGTARYTSGTMPTKKRFTGQRQDTGVTGLDLYYYNARYYEPRLGRFVSPDSVVPDATDPQDLNRYTYVKNSPLRYDDPSGHCPWCVITGGLAALGDIAYQTRQNYSSSGSHEGMIDTALAINSALIGVDLYEVGGVGIAGFLAPLGAAEIAAAAAPGVAIGASAIGAPAASSAAIGMGAGAATMLGVVASEEEAISAGATGKQYSVAYRMKLPQERYHDDYEIHNRLANAALKQDIASDPEFASMMSSLGVRVGRMDRSPANWTWNHSSYEEGVMELVPRWQHDSSTRLFQQVLHPLPGRGGGKSSWGKP